MENMNKNGSGVYHQTQAAAHRHKFSLFFCQNNAGDLRTALAERKARTGGVGEQRRQLGDTSYMYVLDWLNILSNEDFDGLELRWH